MTAPVDPSDPRDQRTPRIDSLGGLLLIVFARMAGYAALLILALIIARRAGWSFSVADILFWLCAVAIPVAQRRADSAGGASPPAMMPRMLVHLGVAALLWAGAHSLHFR